MAVSGSVPWAVIFLCFSFWQKDLKIMVNSIMIDGSERKKIMIDIHGDISIPFLKKSRFTGSYLGMRYLLQKAEVVVEEAKGEEPEKTEQVIRAVIWPEPFNFEVTPDEKKHSRDFPFTQDGLWAAVDWLNEEHAAGHY